tara:strand:+ start:21 stop:593 length:573 start_codon:yes stop_codon:yes gene_type:complete
MQKITFITLFLLSNLYCDIGLGSIVKEDKIAFSFASNVSFLPNKPSSGESMKSYRFINATILTSYNLEFLYGQKVGGDDNYLGLNYYIPIDDYILSFNFKKRYDESELYRSREVGATVSWKVENKILLPYIKYTLLSGKLSDNFEFLTFGGYISYSRFIFSVSYSLPFNNFQGLYNSKGKINIMAGLYID